MGSEIPPTRTYAVSGLSPDEKYDIRVTAYNAAGSTTQVYTIHTPPLGRQGVFICVLFNTFASQRLVFEEKMNHFSLKMH